jgi:CBS domain-containing protein
MANQILGTAKDILQRSGFRRANQNDTVSSVFSKLKSSHEAIFVFDKEKNFVGLINLYYSLLKRRPSAKEKINRLLYNPPKISLDMPMTRIAQTMVESRVYQLPAISLDGQFIGMVSYRRLLRQLLKYPQLKNPINEVFPFRPPVFISEKETVERARHLMINNRVSRLVVVNKEEKAVGVLSSFDLRQAVVSPSESIRHLSRSPNKTAAGDKTIDRIYRHQLVFTFAGSPARTVIKEILDNDVGSVLIYLKKGSPKPAGIISIRDILNWLANQAPESRPRFLAHFRTPLKEYEKKALIAQLEKLFTANRFLKAKVTQADFQFAAERRRSWRNPLLIVKAIIQTQNQQILQVSAKNKRFRLALAEVVRRAKKRIEKLQKKS